MIRAVFLFLGVFLFSPTVHAATLYLDPQSGTYGQGDTFIVSVRVDTDGECINATNVELSYPTDALRAVDFSRGGSILSLWVQEPTINTETGTVSFAGGIPGGYCGRIQGDPVISNVLGRVVFTVLKGEASEARVRVMPASALYLNDGLGTEATIAGQDALFALQETPALSNNEWITQVKDDTIPPDSFDVIIESTKKVFGGRYFAVFSTVDKQSGLDHYEIFERGAWKRVESPYQLRDQALKNPVEIKAIDKAGNERLGTFDAATVPERQSGPWDYALIIALLMIPIVAGVLRLRHARKASSIDVVPPQA